MGGALQTFEIFKHEKVFKTDIFFDKTYTNDEAIDKFKSHKERKFTSLSEPDANDCFSLKNKRIESFCFFEKIIFNNFVKIIFNKNESLSIKQHFYHISISIYILFETSF